MLKIDLTLTNSGKNSRIGSANENGAGLARAVVRKIRIAQYLRMSGPGAAMIGACASPNM